MRAGAAPEAQAVANEAHLLAIVLALQVVAVARPFTHIPGPSNTCGKDLLPPVAALLETAQISDIM